MRRVVIGIAAVCVIAAAVVVVAAGRDHGTVATLTSRLDGHCASVEHRRREGGTFSRPSLPGVVTDDELECAMLGGTVDVVAFRSDAARAQALARAGDAAGGTCLTDAREAVFENLLAPGMSRRFRDWCRELGGRPS